MAEYLACMKFIASGIDEYCKLKDKERPAVQDEGKRVEKLIKELEELLVNANKQDKFQRLFGNIRVRKGLDRLNSQLYKEIAQITSSIPKVKPKPKNPKDLVSSVILEDAGRQLWENNFNQVG